MTTMPSPAATSPRPAVPPRQPRRLSPLVKIALGLGLFAVIVFTIAALTGISAGHRKAALSTDQLLAQAAQEQFDLGVEDLLATRYELARQRFEYVLQINPDYPGAAELLGRTMAGLEMPTPLPSPTGPPPTPTPTLDVSSLQSLYDQAQAMVSQGGWSTALEALITLRGRDITYRAAEVDALMSQALRNLGLQEIQQGLHEQGIYHLSLAARFGPLDNEAIAWMNSAAFYQWADAHYGLNWAEAARLFGQICSGRTWDACRKYATSAMEYGHLLMATGDPCGAASQYDQSLRTFSNSALEPTYDYASKRCLTATAGTPTPTVTETPTPTLFVSITDTPSPTVTGSGGGATPTSTPTPTETTVAAASETPTVTPTDTPTATATTG
jgi:tetratricopeptide (TPR) repeat protein